MVLTRAVQTQKLPSFLVIGGMKCGTTTFYHDLKSHPNIFLAPKESSVLVNPKKNLLLSEYSELFKNASTEHLCGEVSTEYSMLPKHDGVPSAAASLGRYPIKIIYLLRNPVDRAVSHHFHMHSHNGNGKMEAEIDICLKKYPALIDYSRYGWQLQAWRQHFPDSAILPVVFEEYIQDRTNELNRVFKFLGLRELTKQESTIQSFNKSDGKLVLRGCWRGLWESYIYQKCVRERLPPWIKSNVLNFFMTKAPRRPDPPKPESIKFMIDSTANDCKELTSFLNRKTQIWDSQKTFEKWNNLFQMKYTNKHSKVQAKKLRDIK